MGGVFGNRTIGQDLAYHLRGGRDFSVGEQPLSLGLAEGLAADFTHQGQDPRFEDWNRSVSDDLNVRKVCPGSLDGLRNDFSTVGIVVLIAHESHNLGATLLGIQNQPEHRSLFV